eukprot:2903036-Amphidinium_carterae.1
MENALGLQKQKLVVVPPITIVSTPTARFGLLSTHCNKTTTPAARLARKWQKMLSWKLNVCMSTSLRTQITVATAMQGSFHCTTRHFEGDASTWVLSTLTELSSLFVSAPLSPTRMAPPDW